MSRLFSTLASQIAIPTSVPRLVPTATRPDQDADEFTIIIKISNSGSFSVWPILNLVDIDNKTLAIAGSLNPTNNYLYFDGEVLLTIDPRPEGDTEYLLSFSGKALGVRTVTFYVDGALIGSSEISISNQFYEFAGIGSTISEPYITTTDQATVMKVLQDIYTDFYTANAVTGAGLLFNGLDF